MPEMFKREKYYKKVEPFIDKPVIKVISGIRRCGKSTFLKLLINKLQTDGIAEKSILLINKDSLEFDFIKTYTELDSFVKKKFKKISGKKYLFIDEVQEIEEWERAVTGFFTDNIADIYITGSNSGMLSSELATLLTGRYIEIRMNTLTFSEFLFFRQKKTEEKENEFMLFLKYGGFPGIHHITQNDEVVAQYIGSLYNTVLLKDVVSRNQVRDVGLLERITRFIADNCGNITSAKGINDYLKSQKLSSSVDTIHNYLFWLVSANFIDKVNRYDIKGKRQLELYEKYFLADIGFMYGLLGDRVEDISGKLENIVYLELKSRGYQVNIGKLYDKEVDFIARKNNETKYFQVSYLLSDEKVVNREFGILESLRDNHPKIVLSMDKFLGENKNGIRWLNLIDFLLEENNPAH